MNFEDDRCSFLAETLLKKITKDVVGVCQKNASVIFKVSCLSFSRIKNLRLLGWIMYFTKTEKKYWFIVESILSNLQFRKASTHSFAGQNALHSFSQETEWYFTRIVLLCLIYFQKQILKLWTSKLFS